MDPWYKGFKGSITAVGAQSQGVSGKYEVQGVIEVIPGEESQSGDDEVHIKELPIGKWTRDYKAYLSELEAGETKSSQILPKLESYTE